MVSYFERTQWDEEFYHRFLKNRLPQKIFDMHLHLSDPVLVGRRQETDDWAAQCCDSMPIEDYLEYAKSFYPDQEVEFNALPPVSKNLDHAACNGYLARLLKEHKISHSLMVVRPDWTAEYVDQQLEENGFGGFKPYPDLVSGKKGSDISIFAFMPHHQLEVLNRRKLMMTLHLPRAGRLPDPQNIRELLELRQRYPDIKIVVAHFGRSYAIDTIDRGMAALGDHLNDFHWDMAAVLNPAVLDRMFAKVNLDHVYYGTDLPVFLWHGKRRWDPDQYHNLAREDFPWNLHEEGPEKESRYTYFLYEQMKNILDVADAIGAGKQLIDKLFYQNAEKLMEELKKEGAK